ncbi:MAG: Hpt domain-containing protein, partial [Defluviitaleaceae bacterium]|nr:Hpt domain-containing protein [Defluviitaleaceae bacterium]
ANAVKSAQDMFFKSGFNDFLAKPIDSDKLRELIIKYLPPDKVHIEDKPEGQATASDKEAELRQKSIITFVKENRDVFERITNALNKVDTVTAHRIAHTLKSSAGYLGKMELSEAAASMELSLGAQPPGCTHEQLTALEYELEKVLLEFEPIAKKAEEEKQEAVDVGADERAALLAELRPLLENSDFGASEYVYKLQGIAGMEELTERIDDYDFEGALGMLNSLEQ